MSQDLPRNYVRAESDVPFSSVELHTQTRWDRARRKGAVILNRLSLLGLYQQLKPAEKDIVFAMTAVLGEIRPNAGGLVVDSPDNNERDLIAAAAGIQPKSTYRPIARLQELGIVQVYRVSGPYCDKFEICMPGHEFDGVPDDPEEARATSENSLASESDPTPNPLTNPDFHSLVARAFSLSEPLSKFDKSDSGNPIPEARAVSENAPYAYASIASASAIALRGEEGRSCKELLVEIGFDHGSATNIAKHPNCSPKQIQIAVARCKYTQAKGKLRGSPHAYIRTAIEKKYSPPPTDHELQLRKLPQHEQDVVGPLLEHASANGGAAAILAEPATDARLALLASELVAAAPNAEQDALASRRAAEAARLKLFRQADRVASQKDRLATLSPETLAKYVNAAIASETSPAVAARYEAARAQPLKNAFLVEAIMRLQHGEGANQ